MQSEGESGQGEGSRDEPLLSLRRHDPDQVPRVLLSTSKEVRPEQMLNIGENWGSGEERNGLTADCL